MSRALAQVKFPDGTILYTIYHGTGDNFYTHLFSSEEEAWKNYTDDDDDLGSIFDYNYYDVEIADDYGGGHCYIGRASKHQIVSATYDEFMNKINDGLPDWWLQQK